MSSATEAGALPPEAGAVFGPGLGPLAAVVGGTYMEHVGLGADYGDKSHPE